VFSSHPSESQCVRVTWVMPEVSLFPLPFSDSAGTRQSKGWGAQPPRLQFGAPSRRTRTQSSSPNGAVRRTAPANREGAVGCARGGRAPQFQRHRSGSGASYRAMNRGSGRKILGRKIEAEIFLSIIFLPASSGSWFQCAGFGPWRPAMHLCGFPASAMFAQELAPQRREGRRGRGSRAEIAGLGSSGIFSRDAGEGKAGARRSRCGSLCGQIGPVASDRLRFASVWGASGRRRGISPAFGVRRFRRGLFGFKTGRGGSDGVQFASVWVASVPTRFKREAFRPRRDGRGPQEAFVEQVVNMAG
jgi:hypothetical protein